MKSQCVAMLIAMLTLPAVPTYGAEQPKSAGDNRACWCGPLPGATYTPASLRMMMRDKFKYDGQHVRIRGYLHLKPGDTYVCPSPGMRRTRNCLTLIASKTMYRNRTRYHGTWRTIRGRFCYDHSYEDETSFGWVAGVDSPFGHIKRPHNSPAFYAAE